MQTGKIPNLKITSLKQKLIKASIISAILLIATFIISSTYYVAILQYPDFFGEGLFTIFNQKIYLLNLFDNDMKVVFERTPLATQKLKIVFFVLFLSVPVPFLFLRKKKWKDEFGSARWGDYDDLRPNKKGKNKIATLDFLADEGVVIGEVKEKVLHDNENTHMSLIAPTRGGKGVGFVIPTLVEGWKQSVVVLDIKKENFNMSSGHRAQAFDNNIIKFEALADTSSKYNPLDELGFMTSREIEKVRSIALNIVGEEKTNDPFWNLSAVDIMSSVLLYAFYSKRRIGDKPTKVRATITDAVKFITDPNVNLLDKLKKYKNGQDFLLFDDDKEILKKIYYNESDKVLIEKGLHPFVANQFSYLAQMPDKTLQSVVATAKAKLAVFELPTVTKNTSRSDFKIMDIVDGEKPVSLYIVVSPGDIELLSPLIRVMIVQMVDKLSSDIRKKKNRVLFLLDEFTSIGKMTKIEKGLAYVAGFGIKIVIVLQGIDQLIATYGKENGILSNCQTRIFFRPNDNETAEYLHKQLGVKTIRTKSYSYSKSGRSKNTNWTHRDLLTLSEIAQFPSGKSIILTGIKPPLAPDKVLFFERDDMLKATKEQPRFYSEGQLFFEKKDNMGRFEVDRLKTKIVNKRLYHQILEEKEQEKKYEIEQIEKMKRIEINKILKEISDTDQDTTEYKKKLLEIVQSFRDNELIKNIGLIVIAELRKLDKIDFEKDKDLIEQFRNVVKKANSFPKNEKLDEIDSNKIIMMAKRQFN